MILFTTDPRGPFRSKKMYCKNAVFILSIFKIKL